MRRTVLLAGLALAIGVLLPASGVAAVGGSDLPIKASQTGYCTQNILTGQGHCLSTGPFSHLGLSTTEQHVQSVPTGPGTTSWSTTWTLTAANGDQVFGTATGTASAVDAVHFMSHGHYISTGGTGRFADVSATLDAHIHITIVSVVGTIATQFVEVTGVGALSY